MIYLGFKIVSENVTFVGHRAHFFAIIQKLMENSNWVIVEETRMMLTYGLAYILLLFSKSIKQA